MASRRALHRELLSPLSVLDAVAPAHRALCLAQVGLLQTSPHSEALRRASEALHRLAADLGHPGRLAVKAPAVTGR